MLAEITKLQTSVTTLTRSILILIVVMLGLVLVMLYHTSPASTESTQPATNRAEIGNISIGQKESFTPAKARGYYTASEYARLTEQSLETVYRHATAGKIEGASKCNGRWRFHLITP